MINCVPNGTAVGVCVYIVVEIYEYDMIYSICIRCFTRLENNLLDICTYMRVYEIFHEELNILGAALLYYC